MRMEREAAELSSRLHSDTMQVDRMRLLLVQAQLYVVPPAATHREGAPHRCAWRPYTRVFSTG